MGISRGSLLSMCYARENGVDFTHSMTVGRQYCFFTKKEIDTILGKYDPLYFDQGAKMIESMFAKPKLYAEELFQYFGAKQLDSLDYSDYEGATIIHDMNTPVDNQLKNKYTLVWDGGSLEHIFNFPVAIKNCMDMVKPKGHLIIETPANNFFGHGFYQFSPELFFSLLDRHNSFTNTRIFMQGYRNNWYEVISPKIIKDRHTLCPTDKASQMLIISEKIGDVPDFITALQSDYVDVWGTQENRNLGERRNSQSFVSYIYRKTKRFIPRGVCEWGERKRKLKTHYILIREFTNQHKIEKI